MVEPKCPDCEGTELDVKIIEKKLPPTGFTHITSIFYCLKCGKIIQVDTMKY